MLPQIDFQTIAAIGVIIMMLEEFIDRLWNLDGWQSQTRTIFIGIIIGEAGSYFHFGMFADPAVCGAAAWYICGAAVGFYAAVVANVAFLTPIAKAILEGLKIRPKEK